MGCYLALVSADFDLAVRGVQRVVASLPAVFAKATTVDELEEMSAIARKVQGAALYYRPGARCLPQAVAITRLLRRQSYPVTLTIAVRRFPFAAHAWVECAGQVLTDRQDVSLEFTPILRNIPSKPKAGATA
jgi:hypothetical protein